MAEKIKMRDMVVILPGITGSVLQKDGKDIWAISGQAFWQILNSLGDSIQQLKLTQDDPEAESLGDGIKPIRIARDIHLIPGLEKVDGYTKTSLLITDNFDVITGNIYEDADDKAANFYHFPYDWRRDNRANARILKRLLDKRLKTWREFSGNQNAKVILLAHSMGGLVSRYYLEVLQGWQDCKALFTFGTPYRGSLNSVNSVANGYKKLFLDFTEVMRSFTSIYQLFPIYEVIKIGDSYQRVAEADNLPHIDKQRAADALAFHREIEAAVKINWNKEDYRNNYKTIPIIGIQQPTFQSALLVDGNLTISEDLPAILQSRPDLSDGDGTVPQVSAIPIELSNSLNNNFIAEQHGSLQNSHLILEDLLNRLATSQFDLGAVRAPQSAISLSLDDLYLTSESIEMRVKLIATSPGSGKLKATITSVSDETNTFNFDFEEREKEWVLNVDDLQAGLYRLKVETENSGQQFPTPVHDVFEVVEL